MTVRALHREGSLLTRAEAGAERAAIDEETRTATFVVATERPVPMWFGTEVLRMSGVDLRRFKKNPVVVDSHNTWSIRSILGTAKVRKEGTQLLADITFDETDEGEAAWQRVRSGSLRATSIGYMPDRTKTKQLLDGETDGKGESLVSGPAVVCKSWELREITMCPVPADEDALRRSYYGASRRSGSMKYSELETDEGERPGRPQVEEKSKDELEAERASRVAKLRADKRASEIAEIRGFTPEGLKAEAEACILEGLGVEDTRKRLLEARTKKNQPVGTPEPAPAPTPTPAKPKSDADEIRSLVANATGQAR